MQPCIRGAVHCSCPEVLATDKIRVNRPGEKAKRLSNVDETSAERMLIGSKKTSLGVNDYYWVEVFAPNYSKQILY